MATFHGNSDSSCNIDDLERIPIRSRETMESIIMTFPDHPGVLRTKERLWGETNVEYWLLCNSKRQESTSLRNDQKSWKSVNIDEHDRSPSPFTPCGSFLEVPGSLGTKSRRSDVVV